MKIRVRLTLWHFSVALIIVLFFSLGTYWGMKRLLFRTLDDELEMMTMTIERSYDPFFGEFDDLRLTPENLNRYLGYYIVVYNNAGNPIFASPMTQKISLGIPAPKKSTTTGFTITINVPSNWSFLQMDQNKDVTFRAISRPLHYQDQRIGWITIGLPIERIQESMHNLLMVLLIGTVAAVVLIGIGGYFLTRQTLDPVNKITQKANNISSTNLDERIEIQKSDDELGQLTVVLNNLLERLQKAFHSQQQFMADAAHELKTPLTVLRAHWESELNNPDIPLEMKEKFVQDIEAITRLNHMINNLLLLTQTESIQDNFVFRPVRLDELLRTVISDSQILAEIKSQKISIVEMPEANIQGDSSRLYQLFFNLLDNAIRYTPENGNIWLSLRLNNHWTFVEIQDNGPGIPEQDLPHIFERFYRVQKDRSRSTGGSGLGLSICELIAEGHNGTIKVESKMGEGSQFRVSLPLPERN